MDGHAREGHAGPDGELSPLASASLYSQLCCFAALPLCRFAAFCAFLF
jgi:hypothetical protein